MIDNLVSVIVPVFKVEKYLNRCVDSIIGQTYKDLEIILVDDGSPDNCVKICDEYAKKDTRIKVIHKENGGLSSARNAGLDIAEGEYISFVDSDDWICENFIERLVCAIKATKTHMSSCEFYETFDESIEIEISITNPIIIAEKRFYNALVEESYAGYAWNKLYLSKIISQNNLRFDEKIFNGEDLPFTCEYLKYCEKVCFIKEKLYNYFIHPNTITTAKGFSKNKTTIIYAREKVLKIIEECAPECIDIVLCGYLSHLIKLKYLLQPMRIREKALYDEISQKIKQHKTKILKFSLVSLKSRLKLFAMVNFPSVLGYIYRKQEK